MHGFAQFSKACVLLCAWLGFYGQACAQEKATQNADVYLGSLAGKDIVLTFSNSHPDTNGNLAEEQIATIKARYFYRKFGKVIPIVEQANGLLAECAQTFDELICDKPTGYWSFVVPKKASKANISAQWRATPAGAAQQVSLTPVVADSSSKLDPWTKLLGSGPTKLMGIKSMNGVSAGMLVDIRSGAKVPQLVSGYPDEVLQLFNIRQMGELQSRAAYSLTLSSMGGSEDVGSSIQFASPKWLTIGGGSGGYYGGAHPLHIYFSITFNVLTGDPVDELTTFFRHLSEADVNRFPGSVTPSETLDSFVVPLRELRRLKTIEGFVTSEINKLLNGSVRTNAWHEDCKEASNWLGQGELTELVYVPEHRESFKSKGKRYRLNSVFELMPTQKGLAVYTNETPEVTRRCRRVMFTIPWNRVQPYITKSLNNE